MKVLIIGYGSIGARHARLLSELKCQAAVVSERKVDFPKTYASLAAALAVEQPSYIVIANATSQHHDSLLALAKLDYAGTVLVEKPVFSNWVDIKPLPFQSIFVGYNLRFHPIIKRLKLLLDGEQVLSVLAYVGQYLPDWRPDTDYRESYSASAAKGGGVLRDLSHELDYLTWLLGGWKRVSALGGKFSQLEITSDDIYALSIDTPACPIVTVQMNYLDRLTRRFVLINTSNHTIEADFIKGVVRIDGEVEMIVTERDYTYNAMHEAVLTANMDNLCTLKEGLEVMQLIESAELSAQRSGEWVVR